MATKAKAAKFELSQEEIAVIEKLRAEKQAKENAEEIARRQQVIVKSISDLLDQAKAILIDAKQVAKDNNLQYEIEGMVLDMINQVSDGGYWYGSDQSHC